MSHAAPPRLRLRRDLGRHLRPRDSQVRFQYLDHEEYQTRSSRSTQAISQDSPYVTLEETRTPVYDTLSNTNGDFQTLGATRAPSTRRKKYLRVELGPGTFFPLEETA